MITQHEKEFKAFKEIHDLYRQDPEKWQDKYNEVGKPIMDIVIIWEGRLCGKMEGSGRGMYSGGVSEKFRQEIRSYFPSIDMVGIKRG